MTTQAALSATRGERNHTMQVELYRRHLSGNTYFVRDPDGRIVGRVEWIMAGEAVGVYCYSHSPKYKPAKIQKIFRRAVYA